METVVGRFAHEGMTRRDVKTNLIQSTAHELGRGISTTAYSVRLHHMQHFDLPPPSMEAVPVAAYEPVMVREHVIRVSKNEAGIRNTIDVAMRHPEDPFAPKVYGIVELRDGFACEMEYLDKFPNGESYMMGSTYFAGQNGFGGVRFDPTEELFKASPYMRELRDRKRAKGLQWDLHFKNIARRVEDKHLVIMDPLYGGGRYEGHAGYTGIRQRAAMRDEMDRFIGRHAGRWADDMPPMRRGRIAMPGPNMQVLPRINPITGERFVAQAGVAEHMMELMRAMDANQNLFADILKPLGIDDFGKLQGRKASVVIADDIPEPAPSGDKPKPVPHHAHLITGRNIRKMKR